ncbi:MAG: zinc ribbon domain-containing protein [Clostridia bacterium]|nr:zinc ribbon domain-containing protein [Clostridia bacterium]
MYCSHCGNSLQEGAVVCTQCGYATPQQPTVPAEPDAPSPGFAILGFFFPLVGLILYLIYEGKQPLKAKSAGKGAIIGFVVGLILYIAIFVLSFLGVWAIFFNVTDILREELIEYHSFM